MGLISRIFKVGKSHANKIVDNMEDPAVMLEQVIKDSEKELHENNKRLQQVLVQVKQQQGQVKAEIDKQNVWENKAQQFLNSGKGYLVLQALKHSTEHEDRAATYQEHYNSLNNEYLKLKSSIDTQRNDLETTKRMKEIMLAQLQYANIKIDINVTKAKTGNNGESALLDRMIVKTNQTVAEADAAEEMASDICDSLENEFKTLNTPSISVSDKLAIMKSKMENIQ